MSTEERKLAAIVFTDIVGFTELMGQNEKSAMVLLEKQKRLLRPIIENFNGEWLKEIGDGTLSSFPSAVQAVTCALEIQRILDHDPELTVRIGIHIGDIIKKDGDVFGDGVNIASRLEPLAEPGGICVSERVYEDIRNKPDINSAFQDEQMLKGLDRPIKVYSVFTKMGEVPPEKSEKRKSSKSKIPYVIAGVIIGLLVTVFGIKQSGGSSVMVTANSLAVFNFENLSEENENDRTGQILQELVITDLSDMDELKVYSSQRLFDIQKQIGTKDSRYIDPSLAMDIAREAGAASMMTGNIIKIGNAIVLTSRLLDVSDGSVIKSRKVEGTDIYTMVDQLSSFVIEDLNLDIVEAVDLAVSKKTSSSMTAYNHFIAGNDLLNQGKFNQAVIELQKSVERDPSFKKALYKLAIAQWWATGVEVASSDSAILVTLDKYIDLPNISEDEKKLGKGVKNIVSKQFLDALETFEYLVELHPDNKEYQYLLGECYFHGTENTLKALDAFEDALGLDPEFELANIHLIDLYMWEKRYDKTITLLERELEKNPKSLGALSNLGIIKLHQGRSEEGIEIANQILEIDSAHFGAKFGKTLGLLELNRFDEAEPLILDLRKKYDNHLQSLMLKNGFYYLQGKFLERRKTLLKVFNEKSLDKKDAMNRQLLAKAILFGASVSKDKKSQKNNIIQFKGINDPEVMLYIDFLYNMAWAHAVLGDLESFDHYQKRIQNLINEKELTNSWEKDYIPLTYLDAAYFKQDWKQVITEYRNISNSRSGQIFRDLCRLKKCEAEFHLKKYDIALLTAGKMVSPDQDYRTFPFSRPFGYYWQGRIYEEIEKQNEAIASYEKLMELWKDGDERIPERRDTIKRLKRLKKVS